MSMTADIYEELSNSGAFAAVSAPQSQRFVLDIVVDERSDSTLRTVTSILSTLTVSVIPLYSRREFELQAVLYREGLEVKRYRFQDHETDVGWLFFAFVQPFVNSRWGSTPENLTRHLVRQIVLDGSLRS